MTFPKDLEFLSAAVLSLRRIILSRVQISFHEPFRISSGVVSEKESLIVHLKTPHEEGFGEASPMSGSFYSSDTPDSVWQTLSEVLLPKVIRMGTLQMTDLLDLFQKVPGENFAKAGLEGAFWDACANRMRQPLFKLLGARARPLASGVAVGIYTSIEDLLSRIERFHRDGYQRVKIKIQPGWDIEPVRAIRRCFGPLSLMVDANAAYTLDDCATFDELDRQGLMMIEQPLPAHALEEHAELQKRLRTPICLDESAESLSSIDDIIRHGSARIINIKVQRVGGLLAAWQMHDRCFQSRIPCWLGTMPELGIATAQSLHLGMLENFVYPTDVEASDRWFTDEIVDPPIRVDAQGWIRLPEGPGMGYRVNCEKIDRYCIDREVFEV